MDFPKDYLKKFQSTKQTSDQILAGEIWSFFNKKASFPLLIGLISKKGNQFVRETFFEIQKSDAQDKLALFLWKLKQAKIVWK